MPGHLVSQFIAKEVTVVRHCMMPRINYPQISSWGGTKFPSSKFKSNATTQRERGRKSPEA